MDLIQMSSRHCGLRGLNSLRQTIDSNSAMRLFDPLLPLAAAVDPVSSEPSVLGASGTAL